MKFDVAIIGGGLAGLTCGITLQKQGKQCVVINNGQAAIDFSSGSMDLLSHLPDGQKVRSFSQGFLELAKQSPAHPYLLFGQEKVIEKAQQFEQLAAKIGLALQGSTLQNHYRVTPLGGLYTTWLSAITVPQLAWEDSRFPHQHIAILGIEGYHDFQPQLLADNLIQNPQFAGCKITTGYLNIPELDRLRSNAREFRSINIAQLLEHKLAFSDLVEEIKQASAGASAVFLPACFGVDDGRFLQHLIQACALDLYELPTLPPSLLGMRQHKTLRQEFEQVGGIMLNGDKALNGIFEGNRVTRLYTRLHQEEGIAADHFVLASGSFFSNGLVADFERIIEPVFKADIIGLDNLNERNRLSWTATRFSSSQPYQSAGVAINAHCQVKKYGEFIENLYAVGNVIGGYNALQLGCGSGISVVTALIAAEQILSA